MVNKRNLYTAMGITLSFIIAVGGWVLTSTLIDRKSDTLLSATGSIHVNTPPVSPKDTNDDDETPPHRRTLSESQIYKVLQSWEAEIGERPHEPVDGQLSMEQAIDIGKTGLSYFYEQGIIPAELLEYDKTNAYLCEKQPRGQENYTINPYYSYWSITFSGENKRVTLVINAMTGQIWEAAISGAGIAETEKALDAFISYLDFGDGDSYITDGTISIKSYSDGMLYAIARRYTSTTTSVGEEGLEGFMRIYLSTQAPIIE